MGMNRPRRFTHCCRFDSRFVVITATIITLSMSFLSLIIYIWKCLMDSRSNYETDADDIQGYQYGVEISQLILIGVHFLIIMLSTMLLVGICRENMNLIFSWLVGFVVLMCLEIVCMIYSVVLVAHVHQGLDALLQAEVAFCLTRLLVNGLAITSVIAFYQQLTIGQSWKPLTNNNL